MTANTETRIEKINKSPVLRLRDRLLPLVSLGNLLKLHQDSIYDLAARLADENSGIDETFIVVTQVGTYTFGIIVDRVFDTEEIVVKPVAPILRHISMFSGNTILGDGSVIMILDPNGIATATGEVTMNPGASDSGSSYEMSRSDDMTSLLIFRAGGDDLKAVPLALVARLEEVDMTKVEYSFGRPVVQYRGQLMPLVAVSRDIEVTREGRQAILVFSDRDRSMGLLVDEIVDIVESRLKVELKAEAEGIIGTAIIEKRAADVIDTGYYLTEAFGDWFGKPEYAASAERNTSSLSVLLVDDSPFFRNLLTPLLSVSGYEVTTVDSAEKAMAVLETGMRFDAIVSDIEMPGMNGFDFAKAVRADARYANVPLYCP